MSAPRCDARGPGGKVCKFPLRDVTDALGRVRWVCDACERRKAGICRDCPRPVSGTVGKSHRCDRCRRKAVTRDQRNYAIRDIERKRKSSREANARIKDRLRNGAPPMTRAQALRLARLARSAALTPERRREIALNAVTTRWARYRRRVAAANVDGVT